MATDNSLAGTIQEAYEGFVRSYHVSTNSVGVPNKLLEEIYAKKQTWLEKSGMNLPPDKIDGLMDKVTNYHDLQSGLSRVIMGDALENLGLDEQAQEISYESHLPTLDNPSVLVRYIDHFSNEDLLELSCEFRNLLSLNHADQKEAIYNAGKETFQLLLEYTGAKSQEPVPQ